MAHLNKIRAKDIVELGYPEGGKVVSVAINAVERCGKKMNALHKLSLLAAVLENPEAFLDHEHLGAVAKELAGVKLDLTEASPLKLTAGIPYNIYGAEHIEYDARLQMDMAMRLPVARAGALMPDAHSGYGLPIGGVLATDNAVIPYAVGVDIACRMCLTLYELPATYLDRHRDSLRKFLTDSTRFGSDVFDRPKDHEVLERSEFRDIRMVKQQHQKAALQMGTSGSGNHFVEFGIAHVQEAKNGLGMNGKNLPAGQYLAVLSHSGSRALGAAIAGHYTKIAMDKCRLPKGSQNLAWLDLSTQEGMEYWLAMNLAGDYASACHAQIHDRLAKAMGERIVGRVENHHNFAWKEMVNGREMIVHRKGATPAGQGVLGVIPGTMVAPGFIVRGKGNAGALQSASHGAGRTMSRSGAKNAITKREMAHSLKINDVELIGGGVDEAPAAYKDISQVMASQADLVEVLGFFQPKIVRMAGE